MSKLVAFATVRDEEPPVSDATVIGRGEVLVEGVAAVVFGDCTLQAKAVTEIIGHANPTMTAPDRLTARIDNA